MSVRFLALSGTTGVTENFYIYEHLRDGKNVSDAIIVDCGVGFPEPEMFGVDLVIPDFEYVRKNRDKIRGVFITHGHEDHLGALPFLFSETRIAVPVWASKLVAGFIKEKFDDYKQRGVDIRVFNPEKDNVTVGPFTIHPFRISHSVPDSCGFAIDTPEGRMFHIPDYKFDWTPVDGRPFDVARMVKLATEMPPVSLASDSLGSTSEGYTRSEMEIEPRFEAIMRDATKAVYVTTISSNISRMQQVFNVAARLGRQVLLVGRSIDKKVQIAAELGYVKIPQGLVVTAKQAQKIAPSKIVYLITGCYGQAGSALYRASIKEHQFVSINEGDVVIFSADPAPPGSKASVDFMVDRLFEIGAAVHYYDTQEDLHVSGHGSIEDIKMLFALTKPKYLIPIGGTIRHMQAYKDIAAKFGYSAESVFQLKPGDSVVYAGGKAAKGEKIPVREIMVDGLGIGDVGEIVLRDRHHLSQEGVVIVVIQMDAKTKLPLETPELISRGFVFKSAQGNLLANAAAELTKHLTSIAGKDDRMIKHETADFLDRYFSQHIRRRPMILPVIVEA